MTRRNKEMMVNTSYAINLRNTYISHLQEAKKFKLMWAMKDF